MVETWSLIIEHLRRPIPGPTQNNPTSALRQPELAGLMRTCRLFNHLTAPVLYRFVATDSLAALCCGYFTDSDTINRISKAKALTYTRTLFIEVPESILTCSSLKLSPIKRVGKLETASQKKRKKKGSKNRRGYHEEIGRIFSAAVNDLAVGLEFLGPLKRAGCLPRLDSAAHFALCPSSSRIIDSWLERTEYDDSAWIRIRRARNVWATNDIPHICQTGSRSPWHANSFSFGRPDKPVIEGGEKTTLYIHNISPPHVHTDSGGGKTVWSVPDGTCLRGEDDPARRVAGEIKQWISLWELNPHFHANDFPLNLDIVILSTSRATPAEQAAITKRVNDEVTMDNIMRFLRDGDKVNFRFLVDEVGCPACGWSMNR